MTIGVLWIAATLISTLTEQAAHHAENETGGILLGYTAHRSSDVVVLDALGPGPNATHTPSYFDPDHRWQQQQLAARYKTTDGVHGYVGDWHSHPNSAALPSPRDRAVLRRIAGYPAARLPNPVMVILGTQLGSASVRAMAPRPGRLRPSAAVAPRIRDAGKAHNLTVPVPGPPQHPWLDRTSA